MNRKILDFLDQICGEKIAYIGRTSDMMWIGIGDIVEIMDQKGKLIERSRFALHVQCSWKIVNSQKKEIIVASSDFYFPQSTIDDEDFYVENFEWDIQGKNLFDKKAKKWFDTRSSININSYNINEYGDLQIIFSNNERLRIFVDSSDNTEAWRLFNVLSGKHLVFTGQGYQF